MKPWPTKKLGEVCDLISPGIKKFEGSKKYVATADVDFDKITNFTKITCNNRPSRANMEAKENDVLVARMAETKKFLVADKELQNNYIFSTGFAVLRTKKDLFPKYLFYFLYTKDFNLQKNKLAVGATQKAINNPALKKIKIPILPFLIQQKIVERLDAIKKAQELNDKQIALADELFQSLLHRELDLKRKDWEVVKLKEVCTKITDGVHRTPKYVEEGIPFLSVKNIKEDKIYFRDVHYISREEHNQLIKRCNPKKEDVLYTKVGTTGIAKTIDTDREFSIFVSVALLKIEKKKILPEFLEKVLNSPFCRKQAYLYTQGVANQNLVIRDIERIKIPLPPIETQRKIVEKLSAVQEYKKKLIEQKSKLKELFESVLNKSMIGKLVK